MSFSKTVLYHVHSSAKNSETVAIIKDTGFKISLQDGTHDGQM